MEHLVCCGAGVRNGVRRCASRSGDELVGFVTTHALSAYPATEAPPRTGAPLVQISTDEMNGHGPHLSQSDLSTPAIEGQCQARLGSHHDTKISS